MGHALALCQCEPIEKPIERRAEDAAQILSRGKKNFLSGGRRGATLDDREDCFGRATIALTRAIQYAYIVSSIDMAGMIGMAQTLAVYHFGYHTETQADPIPWTHGDSH